MKNPIGQGPNAGQFGQFHQPNAFNRPDWNQWRQSNWNQWKNFKPEMPQTWGQNNNPTPFNPAFGDWVRSQATAGAPQNWTPVPQTDAVGVSQQMVPTRVSQQMVPTNWPQQAQNAWQNGMARVQDAMKQAQSVGPNFASSYNVSSSGVAPQQARPMIDYMQGAQAYFNNPANQNFDSAMAWVKGLPRI